MKQDVTNEQKFLPLMQITLYSNNFLCKQHVSVCVCVCSLRYLFCFWVTFNSGNWHRGCGRGYTSFLPVHSFRQRGWQAPVFSVDRLTYYHVSLLIIISALISFHIISYGIVLSKKQKTALSVCPLYVAIRQSLSSTDGYHMSLCVFGTGGFTG